MQNQQITRGTVFDSLLSRITREDIFKQEPVVYLPTFDGILLHMCAPSLY